MHLQALADQGDPASIAELHHGPKLPKHAEHIWLWWKDLTSTRGGNGFSVNPIDRHDIRVWQEDEGISLQAWERRAILRIDIAYRASLATQEEE
ncbi:MAG: phage tail assembly chaperone [Pseudomonadota bacterium]